jgi:hypothetical protein
MKEHLIVALIFLLEAAVLAYGLWWMNNLLLSGMSGL